MQRRMESQYKMMVQKVRDYIQQFHMISEKDQIVVGLSGGADSVCLFHILCSLKDELDFSLEAVHIHHGIRQESDEEADFVKKLCSRQHISCRIHKIDVPTYQKEQHIGMEEAARILRYQIFEEEIRSGKKIALAHHKNDQAETVLFHLFRGSGIRGLKGMVPVRDQYIRPILCLSRNEIENYLQKKGISFVTDQSNFDVTYSRNRIRHDILPVAEEICEGAIQHICNSAQNVNEAMDYLEDEIQKAYHSLVAEKNGCLTADKDRLFCMHPYLRSEIILKMLFILSGKQKDISKVHVDSIVRLMKGQSGREVHLIYGMKARVDQKELILLKEDDATAHKESTNIKAVSVSKKDIDNQDEVLLSFQGRTVRIRKLLYEKDRNIPKETYTKWFDYDRLNTSIEIRFRQSGDFFFCTSQAKKKVKDYMIDEKISVTIRDDIPMIADGNHILWIVGYRISEYYKISDNTKYILEITIEEGE